MTEPRLPRERYRVLGLLGTGGMASVWRVLDVRLNVERAVKVLPQGVLREAQLAAALNHPHIVSVHDVLDAPEGACVVMELAQGSVADHVATHGPLAPRVAATLMADIADALAAAHAAGVVHRDIKPQNLLVFAGGRVKLGDFGIAALLDGDAPAESTQAILGSVPFMAPEQRRGQALPASDVYAAAVSLAWMVTGDLPGDLYVDTVRDALRQRLGAEAAPLVEVLAAAGAHAPEARLTAGERARALRAYGGEVSARLGAITRPATPAAPSGRWVRVREASSERAPQRNNATAAWGFAALALLVGGGAGVWAGVQDAVRGRLVEEPESVRLAREWAALPVCATPGGWNRDVVPRRELDADGLREASPTPLVVDLDGDGNVDRLYVHNASEATRIWWGPGTVVSEPHDVPSSRGRGLPSAGDIDGDGRLDVMFMTARDMRWLRQTAPRVFAEEQVLEEGENIRGMSLGDLDRDGRADLLLNFVSGALLTRRNLGSGAFAPYTELGIRADATALTNVTGDSGMDLVTLDDHQIWVREGLPAGRLGPARAIARVPLSTIEGIFGHRGRSGGWVAVGGLLEPDTDHRAPFHVMMVPLTENGKSQAPCRLAATFPLQGTVADINGDDLPDVLASDTCSYCTSEYGTWASR